MSYTRTAAMLMLFLFFLILSGPSGALPSESDVAQSEITYLLAHVEKSGCRFNRNGTWYNDTKVIRQHMEAKYRYFQGKGRINSAEDFVERAASKSEMTGKPYLVKCTNGPEMPTAQWLIDELSRYRKEK